MSVTRVQSAILRGLEALPVTVECAIYPGDLPGFTYIGLPDSQVLESRARVRSALKSAGYAMPKGNIVINLLPNEVRKTGSQLDLAIAKAVLAASGQIPESDVMGKLFVGELNLDGRVCQPRGIEAYAALAEQTGCVLATSVEDGIAYPNCTIADMPTLESEGRTFVSSLDRKRKGSLLDLDFADIHGMETAKRAAVIAAAGKHGMLMVGPPGAGKTMFARRMTTILPDMTDEEYLQSRLIESVSGIRNTGGDRPFRAPHHSISKGGLIGGGRPVRPGEITLAHGGVLFLDELDKFPSSTLDSMRPALAEKEVRIVRVDGIYTFPADVQLVAAANPCPCGCFGDPGHECRCSAEQIMWYQDRLGGALKGAFDIQLDIPRISGKDLLDQKPGLGSSEMRDMVAAGREFAKWRSETLGDTTALDGVAPDGFKLLNQMANRLQLSAGALNRMARVARTIADLDESTQIQSEHLLEASSFRNRSRHDAPSTASELGAMSQGFEIGKEQELELDEEIEQ